MNSHVMREPFALQNRLDELCMELDTLTKDQDIWANEGAKARDEWEPVFDSFSEQLQSEYDDGEHKGAFPGQDRLESMCRRATPENREVWRRIRRADHMLEKKNRHASNVKQEIGGLQSLLKSLDTEVRASGAMR